MVLSGAGYGWQRFRQIMKWSVALIPPRRAPGSRGHALDRLARGLLSLTLASAASSGCEAATKAQHHSVAQLLAAASAAENRGDDGIARRLLDEIVSAEPGNSVAHYDLGLLDQRQGQAEAAIHQYAMAVASDPRDVPALYNEATIYGATDPPTAIRLYEEVIHLQPHAPTAYLNLGLLEVTVGNQPLGLRDLLTAIRQEPALLRNVPADLIGPLAQLSQQIPERPSPSAR